MVIDSAMIWSQKRRKHNVGYYFLDTTIISADFPILIWDRKDRASNAVSDIHASQTQNIIDNRPHYGNIQTNWNPSSINTHHDIRNQHLSNISAYCTKCPKRIKHLTKLLFHFSKSYWYSSINTNAPQSTMYNIWKLCISEELFLTAFMFNILVI